MLRKLCRHLNYITRCAVAQATDPADRADARGNSVPQIQDAAGPTRAELKAGLRALFTRPGPGAGSSAALRQGCPENPSAVRAAEALRPGSCGTSYAYCQGPAPRPPATGAVMAIKRTQTGGPTVLQAGQGAAAPTAALDPQPEGGAFQNFLVEPSAPLSDAPNNNLQPLRAVQRTSGKRSDSLGILVISLAFAP